MAIVKHENSGHCEKCKQIFDRYPGFHLELRNWFETFQELHPEAHISCAGRGEQDQEAAYLRRASRAHFPHSAHNWNAAFDLFKRDVEPASIYDLHWFRTVVGPAIPSWITWYGQPGSPFYELPHCELADWRELAQEGKLKPVEETDATLAG